MDQTNSGMKDRVKSSINDMQRTYPVRFTLFKKNVIDYSTSHFRIKRVAEYGCVWGVDGAYGKYFHDKYDPD